MTGQERRDGLAARPGAEPELAAPSRRSVLRGAAGAGAAGLAVTALGGMAVPALASTRTSRPAAAGGAAAGPHGESGTKPDEAVIVHLRDAATGEIDVFRGTTQTRLHDRDLAARLLRASQ